MCDIMHETTSERAYMHKNDGLDYVIALNLYMHPYIEH